jgi:VCBS repeat-containing protein
MTFVNNQRASARPEQSDLASAAEIARAGSAAGAPWFLSDERYGGFGSEYVLIRSASLIADFSPPAASNGSATLADQFVAIFTQLDSILTGLTALDAVPVIGGVLPDLSTAVFGTRVQAIDDALSALAPDATLVQIRDAINANGAGFVSAAIESGKLRLTVSTSGSSVGDPITTGFAVGGTSLGLSAQIGFAPGISQLLRFDFLYDPASGDLSYVDRPGNELTFTITADFAFTAGANIGPLSIVVEDVHAGPEASISLGLNLASLSPASVAAHVSGTIDVRNRIKLDLGEDLPAVQGDLVVNWQLGGGDPAPDVQIADVKIKLGDLLAAVAEALQPVSDLFATTPFKQFYDALTEPLPIVDEGIKLLGLLGEYDLVPGPNGDGHISALDLIAHSLKANGDPKYEAIVAFTGVVHLLRQIDELKAAGADLGDASISLGSFRLTDDPNNPFASLANSQELANLRALAEEAIDGAFELANDLAAAVGDDLKIGEKSIGSYLRGVADPTGATATTGIYFPIIENPSEILKFIFPGAFPANQRNAEFFRVDIIENFEHDDEQFFGYGPFVFNLTQKLFAGIDLSVGLDSFGLLPGQSLEDGLFVRAGGHIQNNPHAADGAAAYLDFLFSAGAGIGVAVGGLGVGALIEGGISGDRISLFLRDGGYRPFVGGPVFDGVSGKIEAKLNALFKLDVGLFEVRHRENLVNETILDLNVILGGSGSLGTELLSGDTPGLYLHAGPRAGDRAITGAGGAPVDGYNVDTAESFRVRRNSLGDVIVSAFGIEESYSPPGNTIYAAMGEGSDSLSLAPNVSERLVASGGNGADFIGGGAGADTIWGDSENNADPAQLGADVLHGRAGNDMLDGGGGDDFLEGGDGADTLIGGEGHDTATYDTAGSAVIFTPANGPEGTGLTAGGAAAGDQLIDIEQIRGSAHGDSIAVGIRPGGAGYTIDGAGGDDALAGGAGNDVLIGGIGADALAGGDGLDVASYLGSAEGVDIDLVAGTAAGGEAEGDTFDGIEMLQGSLHGDFLRGDAGDNVLDGLDGDDLLASRGGEDILLGGNGDDIVLAGLGGGLADGGLGRDLLSFEQVVSAGVTVNLLTGSAPNGLVIPGAVALVVDPATNEVMRDAQGRPVTAPVARRNSFEDLTGSTGSDSLTGDDGNNVIRGLSGIDMIRGGIGNDTIHGGDGADELYGEDGDDTIFTGAGSELAGLSPNAAGGFADGGIGNDTITGGSGANELHGGEGDDIVLGGTGHDTLRGDAGNDQLEGGADDDSLLGGIGSDSLKGDGGNDTLRGEAGGDRIDGGAEEDLAFGGDDNDVVTGGTGADTLLGDAGDDALEGGADNDALHGQDGRDDIAGRSGNDTAFGGDGDDVIFGDRRNYVAIHDDEEDRFNNITYRDFGVLGIWNEALPLDFRIRTGPPVAATAILTLEAFGVDWNSEFTDLPDDRIEVLVNGQSVGFLDGAVTVTAQSFVYRDDIKTVTSFEISAALLDPSGNNLIEVRALPSPVFVNDVLSHFVSPGSFSVNRATLVIDLDRGDLDAGGGDDTLYGGAGNDRIHGGEGEDLVDGGEGADILYGDDRDPLKSGGDDHLIGGAGDDTLTGGYGTDILDAGTGKFKVYGGTFLGTSNSGDEIWAESLADNDTLVVDQSDYVGDFYRLSWGYFNAPTGQFGTELRISWSGKGSAESAFELPSTARGVNGVVYYGGAARDLIGFSAFQGFIDASTNHRGTIDDPLNGGPGDDELHGGGGSDELFGGRGSDKLYGDADRDLLFGGAGDDRIETGTGADFTGSAIAIDFRFWDPVWRAEGGLGNDTLISGDDNNVLFGNEGDDTLYGMGGNDILIGERTTGLGALSVAGNDAIFGGDGDDYIDPGLGVETIDGGAGTDKLFINRSTTSLGVSFFTDGTAGSDGTIASNVEMLTYWAGSGNDTVSGTSGMDSVEGNAGDDVLRGEAGRDTLLGGDGNDRLYGGDDIDVLRGGDGDDWIETGGGRQTFGGGTFVGGNAEGGAGNDTIIGDDESNQLFGEDGDDVLRGMGGDDLLVGGTGANTFFGGAGNDTINAGAGIAVADGGDGVDRLTINRASTTIGVSFYSDGTAGSDGSSAINIELLEYYGGSGNDIVVAGDSLVGFDYVEGRGGDDSLTGGAGRDTLLGGDGNDLLDGGADNDRLDGGSGDDVMVVGHDGDQVIELANGGTDTVRASISYALPSEVEHLVLLGTAGLTGTGNAKVNQITGNDGNNALHGAGGGDTLRGGAGDDYLDGGAEGDRMEGGAGDDVFEVDHADDHVVEEAGEGSDTVRSGITYSLGEDLEKLVLTGTADLDGTGNGLANAVTGNSGANRLHGADGDDRIEGRAGDDTLHGGVGADTAVFSGNFDDYSFAQAGGVLTVTDLRAAGDGTDTIDGFEFLSFADGVVTIAGVFALPPTATADALAGIVEAKPGDPGIATGSGNLLTNDSSAAGGLIVTSAAGYYQATTSVGLATVISGQYGYLTIASNGEFSYELDNAWYETDFLNDEDLVADVFTYQVADANGRKATAQLSVTIQGRTEPRIAAEDDQLFVTVNRITEFDASILLNNDNVTTGEPLTVVALIDVPMDGTYQLANGRLIINTALDYGEFDYEVRSATGLVATARIYLAGLLSTEGDDFLSVSFGGTAAILDGGGGDDYVEGTRNADQLYGGDGADTVIGQAGHDLLDGGSGADFLAGGAGDDVYYFDDVGDTLTERIDAGFDTLISSVSVALPDHVEVYRFTGLAGGTLIGNAGDNIFEGGAAGDRLDLSQGGADSAFGGGGDDGFYFGSAFGAGDAVDGGDGSDQLALRGAYQLKLASDAFGSVETMALLSGSDDRFEPAGTPAAYDLTSDDANVAAGAILILNGNGLQADESFTFDGSAERDGSFHFFSGFGVETLTGGDQSDGFFFGDGRFNPATDKVNGTAGLDDQLGLRGDFSAQLVFTASTMTNIDTIAVISAGDTRFGAQAASFSYNIKTHDVNLAAGARLSVNGAGLAAGEMLTFDGSAESDGFFRLIGGAGADVLIGGAGDDLIFGGLGADQLTGNGGADRFVYAATDQSNAAARDTLLGFAAGDKIDLSGIAGGFTFVAGGAFTGAGGQLIALDTGGGNWRVEGDLDGDSVADLVIMVAVADGHLLSAADFVL